VTKQPTRVFVVSYYSTPGTEIGGRRPSSVAAFLASEGRDVVLFTVVPSAAPIPATLPPSGELRRVVIPDVRWGARAVSAVTRVWRSFYRREAGRPRKPGGPMARVGTPTHRSLKDRLYEILDFIDNRKLWSARLFFEILIAARRTPADVIVVSGPPFSPFVAVTLAARLLGIPAVIDFRDPWTTDRSRPSRLVAILRWHGERRLERFAVRRASRVVATTSYICQDLARCWGPHRGNFATVLNGYDADAVVREPPPTGRLVMLYAGTVYMNRSPIALFDAVRGLAESPGVERGRISVQFVGDCSRWRDEPMTRILDEKGIGDIVSVGGEVSRDRVLELTRSSNVLINLAQGQVKQIPGKLFEQAATRRVVLLVTESGSASAEVAAGIPSIRTVADDPTSILGELRRLYELFVTSATPTVDTTGVERLSREGANRAFADIVYAAR
jgi:hypothetical protein